LRNCQRKPWSIFRSCLNVIGWPGKPLGAFCAMLADILGVMSLSNGD